VGFVSLKWRRAKSAEVASGKRIADLGRYINNPVGFCRDIFGIKPWKRQKEILNAFASHQWVCVKSGQKIGKSLSICILAIWFAVTRPNAQSVMTAPTFGQVRRILWREMRNIYPKIRHLIGGGKLSKDPSTPIEFSNGSVIYGVSTNEPENLQGISGENLAFFIDEAAGFADDLFEALLGNSAADAHIFAITNPTKTSGWFFNIFRQRMEDWHRISVSSEESPNIVASEAVNDNVVIVGGLAKWRWLQKMRRACGSNFRKHPLYQVRVLGQFPDVSALSIVSVIAVDKALAAWDVHGAFKSRERLVLGVDPARFGDDQFVIIGRRGNHTIPPVSHQKLDGAAGADQVLAYIRENAHIGEEQGAANMQRPLVNVDVIGWGASVYDHLKNVSWIDVQPINTAQTADDKEQWPNLRTQLWFNVDDFIEGGGTLPPDCPELEGDLLAPEYTFAGDGRRRAESKDKTKKRLGRSPDCGDAFVLCIYRGTHRHEGSTTNGGLAFVSPALTG